MGIEKILVVDDEQLIRSFLAETLQRKNFEVMTAENGKKALLLLKDIDFDLVITDMKMPDLTGLDLIKKIKEISPHIICVVITAFGTIENAVEAMRAGAFNYLLKPFSPDAIEAVIEKANEQFSLVAENNYLLKELEGKDEIVQASPAMKKIMQDVLQVAKSHANVMITGESGTGKEVIAQAIHYNSLRANRPFIRVNCAAIPETLIESEFFGHEKGSFTGANNKKLGRFELAHRGTLLLDEITEVPPLLQPKLLRAIQEQEFERVGGVKPVKVDVRIISTSNRDMQQIIRNKQLREDLFYRLNVVPIHLPPLRERREDILPLAELFIRKFARENHKVEVPLSTGAKKKLLEYTWPGNVRELANVMERAIVLDTKGDVSDELIYLGSMNSFPLGTTLQDLEKKLIVETLAQHNQNETKAAETLGITHKDLIDKILEYKLLRQ